MRFSNLVVEFGNGDGRVCPVHCNGQFIGQEYAFLAISWENS